MLSPNENASVDTIRASGTFDEAVNRGGRIVHVRAHAAHPSIGTVFVRVPHGAGEADMVFTNVSMPHVQAALASSHTQADADQLHKPSRALGSLETALKHRGDIVDMHSHENNNTFSVTVRIPENVFEEEGEMIMDSPRDMVFTGVSLDHIKALAEVHPAVAKYMDEYELHLFHPSKLIELLQEPGAKIVGWHPTMKGSYSIQVSCGDGCQRSFSSVSEEHMKMFMPAFVSGTSQFVS
ncbi:UNVERIFIED_CONTAM: hypothetical protein HDU68_003134 [Siphonaria sp. JEL0065]|nr:hypothetical protein HDU68_003134 [Siphonaria sp. JEL0065]